MSTTFATPAVGGFHKRGRHPDGGHYYGGAETALCELVRGGDMVLREVMYHDDDARDVLPCPVMIEQLRARDVRSKVAVRGRYLLNGARSDAQNRRASKLLTAIFMTADKLGLHSVTRELNGWCEVLGHYAEALTRAYIMRPTEADRSAFTEHARLYVLKKALLRPGRLCWYDWQLWAAFPKLFKQVGSLRLLSQEAMEGQQRLNNEIARRSNGWPSAGGLPSAMAAPRTPPNSCLTGSTRPLRRLSGSPAPPCPLLTLPKCDQTTEKLWHASCPRAPLLDVPDIREVIREIIRLSSEVIGGHQR
jgi:hypothetical protein